MKLSWCLDISRICLVCVWLDRWMNIVCFLMICLYYFCNILYNCDMLIVLFILFYINKCFKLDIRCCYNWCYFGLFGYVLFILMIYY